MAENSHSSTSTATNEQESGNEEIEEVLQTSTSNRRRNTSIVTSGDFHDEDAYEAIESSSHNDSESSFRPNTPKPRGPKKRSPFWKYFRCEGSGKDMQSFCLVKIPDKDNEEIDCKYFGKGRNTKNMRLHLQNYHKEEMKKLKEYEKTAAAAENKSNEPSGAESGVSRSSRGIVDFFNKPSNSSKPRVKNPYPPKSFAYKTFKEDLTRLAG